MSAHRSGPPRHKAVTSVDNSATQVKQHTTTLRDTSAHDDVADDLLDEYEAIRRRLDGPTTRYPSVGRVAYPPPPSVVAPGDAPAGAPSPHHSANKHIAIGAVGQRGLESMLRRGVPYREAARKQAGRSHTARDVPWSGRPKQLRILAGLPRDVTPLPVEAAPIGVVSLAPPSDNAGGEISHVDNDNDDDDDDDDHVDDVDDGTSQHDEQSSPQAPRDSGSQHGRNGSSNPSLTSPAPEPHDDSGASTEQADAHDPTPTGQFLSLFLSLLSSAQRRSS